MLAERTAFGVARSFSGRRWNLRAGSDDAAREIARAGISPVLARLLAARGTKPDELEDLLNPTLRRLMPDPLVLKDMDKAVARVRAALDGGEKIAVFGDYDVDGSTSAALLSDFFAALGRPPRVYIPDRMTEGYGPSAAAFRTLQSEGIGLVITVDCGAAAYEAMDAARDMKLDVVVLDHHAIETAPPTFAQVNPNQPGDTSGLGHVSAAGVTFLFLVALNRELRDAGWYADNGIAEPDLRNYLDVVALATICDVVPLVGVNRAFVRAGLAHMSEKKRLGLSSLAGIARIEAPFTAYHCGFMFGPRINAGGRVGKSSLGVELLTATDLQNADELAALLDLHNRERQAIEKLIIEEALAMGGTQGNAPFVFAHGEGWHPGVVGIVAGRLKERFARPAFVAGFEGGMGRGSARSVAGVDVGAIVRAAREEKLIEAGGGHAMAAGFSLSAAQLRGFTEFLNDRFEKFTAEIATAADLDLDATISPAGATPALVDEIARIGPFGAGNPEPLVVAPDVRIVFADVVGQDHVRLRLAGGDGAGLSAIAFRTATTPLGLALLKGKGRRIHAAGRLRADEWNGQRRVQLQLEDAAAAEA
ncbi:MAG TPA: single-stranded-DNA-specific exonuclease RecJ [Rhizomicrobium sp.]|jgi:single-stranded-DNA-specific exonuclease|nr:single-stranded-DNA-specific exonuclease RecJ [Rhizomicrobium sp.]